MEFIMKTCRKCNEGITDPALKVFCEDCVVHPIRYCKQLSGKFETRRGLREEYPNVYRAIINRKWGGQCFSHMKTLRNIWTYEDCIEAGKKYIYQIDFTKQECKLYDFLRARNLLSKFWLESKLLRKAVSRTESECITEAAKYPTRIQFQDNSPAIYSYARLHGWLPQCCSHMEPCNKNGRSKKDFLENCERNNDGDGVLYLIKCTGGSESFYKIGITSRSVEVRFRNKEKMPYEYMLIKQFKSSAYEIWDLEVSMKSQLKPHRYQPLIKFGGSFTECFRCDDQLILSLFSP